MKVKCGAACCYDFYRSGVIEYSFDTSNQKTESVRTQVGGTTSFTSKIVGEVKVEVIKIHELIALTVDEIANFLIALEKDEYLIQNHPHLASFLPNSIEIELLEQNSKADYDLVLALRRNPKFKIVDYIDKPIVKNPLILLATHIKPWFFSSLKKNKPSFSVATVLSWQSLGEDYPSVPRLVNQFEEFFFEKNYSKEKVETLEGGFTRTLWKHTYYPTYTSIYDLEKVSVLHLY